MFKVIFAKRVISLTVYAVPFNRFCLVSPLLLFLCLLCFLCSLKLAAQMLLVPQFPLPVVADYAHDVAVEVFLGLPLVASLPSATFLSFIPPFVASVPFVSFVPSIFSGAVSFLSFVVDAPLLSFLYQPLPLKCTAGGAINFSVLLEPHAVHDGSSTLPNGRENSKM